MKITYKEKIYEVEKDTKIKDILKGEIEKNKYTVIGAIFNNQYRRLDYKIIQDGNIELIDISTKQGMKIYRSHFIRQLHLRFREDMVLAEDQFFNYHYYKMCKTVAFVNQPNYIYFRDDSGLSKVINLQCCENELENLLYETDFMEQQRIEGREQIIAEYICYLVRRYTFIPKKKNTRAEAVTRLRRMKLLDKRIVLPYWKNNLIYQLMYRKLYNLVYLYRKIGTMIHA